MSSASYNSNQKTDAGGRGAKEEEEEKGGREGWGTQSLNKATHERFPKAQKAQAVGQSTAALGTGWTPSLEPESEVPEL